jgi:hypothetical protein
LRAISIASLRSPLLAGRAELARNDPQQPVGEVLEIVHPVRQQRIVDLAHALAGVLLHALDRRLAVRPESIASLMRRFQPSS